MPNYINVTGEIKDGMWNCPPPFPDFHLKPLSQPEWVSSKVWCDIFEGMHSQTGTYIETPAHFLGPEKSYFLSDIPIQKMINMPSTIFTINGDLFESSDKREPITKAMLLNTPGAKEYKTGDALIIRTDWSSHWMESDFLDRSPYITFEAMQYIIGLKPSILATDFPRWENLENPEGIFPPFYAADILMLAPLAGLQKINQIRPALTVLPLNIPNTCCAPCRAFVTEE